VMLRVRNDHTVQSPHRGRGIVTLNGMLRGFGAKVEGRGLESGRWTYEATLTLRRW
jgi:hypothetical protein